MELASWDRDQRWDLILVVLNLSVDNSNVKLLGTKTQCHSVWNVVTGLLC
jgi:hypothetical protein